MSLFLMGGIAGGEQVPFVDPFQLAAGHYFDENISMKIIAPRIDAERSSNSRYSFAYPGLEYEVPIVVLGGGYPFKYEIISRTGTADVDNASIGETRTYNIGRPWYGTQNQKDYGVIRWTPDAGDNGNTFVFVVRVTGQDGVTQTVSVGGDVDTAKFVFVEDGVTSGDGTKDSPLEDLTELWTDGADTTYQGKFIYIRAGNYSAFTSSSLTSVLPRVFMRYPGDARPVFDGTAKDYSFGSTGLDDFWWSGIRTNGTPGAGVTQCRFFECTTSTTDFDRAMIWDNYFFDGEVGSSGNDNNGWLISLRAGSANHLYTAVVDNTFDTGDSSSNGFEVFTFFSHTQGVAEHNIVKNWTGENALQLKDGVNTWSIRANDLWENNTARPAISLTNQSDGSITNHTQEVVWNFVQAVDDNGCFAVNSQEDADSNTSTIFLRRNTMLANSKVATNTFSPRADHLEIYEYTDNILVADTNPHTIRDGSTPIDVTGSTDAEAETFLTNSTFDNVFQLVITDLITADGALTGSGFTNYYGTKGAEIA